MLHSLWLICLCAALVQALALGGRDVIALENVDEAEDLNTTAPIHPIDRQGISTIV